MLTCNLGLPDMALARPLPLNACELLSTEDILASTGQRVTRSERNDDGYTPEGAYSSTCVWFLANTKSHADKSVRASEPLLIVNAMRWPNGQQSQLFLESFRNASHDHTIDHPVVPLMNLGDEALWWGDGVAVRIGSLSVGVSTMKLAKMASERQPLAERVARRILDHLPP